MSKLAMSKVLDLAFVFTCSRVIGGIQMILNQILDSILLLAEVGRYTSKLTRAA